MIRRLLLVFALLLGVGVRSEAAVALVNTDSCDVGGSGTTCPMSGFSVTVGNLIVVQIGAGVTGTTVSSISDGTSNTYVQAAGGCAFYDDGGRSVDTWYAKNVGTGGSLTITVTYSGSTNGRKAAAWQFSGADTTAPLDQCSVGHGTSTTPAAASVTTTVASEALTSLVKTGGGATFTAGTGYTDQIQLSNQHQEYQITSGTGSFTGDWTLNASVAWAVSFTTWKAPTSAPTTRPTLPLLGVGPGQ